jgi:tetratricopeptide (TPR) repeat protein
MKLLRKTFPGLLMLFSLVISAAAVPLTIPDMLSAGRVDDAVHALNIHLQSAPNDAEAYHLLSRANYHLAKWDQAIAYGEKAIQLNPNNSEYYLWLGRAYGEKANSSNFVTAAGLVKKIRTSFEKAVALDGNNVDARTDLAEFYVEAPGFMGGGTDKAAAQAESIATHDPARALWVRAKIAEKKKDYATAEREYFAAIQADNDADYWLNLASFYRRVGRMDDMETTVNKAISSSKRKTNAYFDAAALLFSAGRDFPLAASLLRKYLTMVPTEDAPSFEAHYMLGQVLEKMGDKDGASSEYRMSLALASSYTPAQNALKRISN